MCRERRVRERRLKCDAIRATRRKALRADFYLARLKLCPSEKAVEGTNSECDAFAGNFRFVVDCLHAGGGRGARGTEIAIARERIGGLFSHGSDRQFGIFFGISEIDR